MTTRIAALLIAVSLALPATAAELPSLRPFPRADESRNAAIGWKKNERLPDLRFKDSAGVTRTIADYRGKVVLINFWATWCPPCQKEMPSLQKLHAALKAHPDIVIMALGLGEEGSHSQRTGQKWGYSYEFMDSLTQYHRDWRLQLSDGSKIEARWTIPTTLVIDRNGIVAARIVGARDWEKYASALIELARSDAPGTAAVTSGR